MDNKKPDYLDGDWAGLIADRITKWENMWVELKNEGVEPIDIWGGREPNFPHKDKVRPRLGILPVHSGSRGIIIVCAGGGFMFKSANEAKPVAEYFHNAGFNAAILDYYSDSSSAIDSSYNVRLAAADDALRAIRYLRYFGKSLGINTSKIAIGGFSAGGMVSALAATKYDYGNKDSSDPVQTESSRPDAVLMFYGTLTDTLGQRASLGFDWQETNKNSSVYPELNIRQDSPPFFMFETHADDPKGILDYGRALAEKGVPFVIHTFMGGPHGGGLYDGKHMDSPLFPHTVKWAELAVDWLMDYEF